MHADRFVLVLLPPKQRQHMNVFVEIANVVAEGLQTLGYSTATLEREFIEGERHIVFAPHLLQADHVDRVPPATILYNFESLDPPREISTTFLREFVPRFEVWDYSAGNLTALKAHAKARPVRHVPFGYTRGLTRIAPAAEQDIDVFFSGAISERRARVLNALKGRGLNVATVSDVYGEERDRLIGRSKVVLNIHFHEDARSFESPRVVDLLANSKAVVTELKPDVHMDADLKALVDAAPHDQLADACEALVRDAPRRRALERAAFEGIRQRDESRILAEALKEI